MQNKGYFGSRLLAPARLQAMRISLTSLFTMSSSEGMTTPLRPYYSPCRRQGCLSSYTVTASLDYTARSYAVRRYTARGYTARDYTALGYTVRCYTALGYTALCYAVRGHTVMDLTASVYTAPPGDPSYDHAVCRYTACGYTAHDYTALGYTVCCYTALSYTALCDLVYGYAAKSQCNSSHTCPLHGTYPPFLSATASSELRPPEYGAALFTLLCLPRCPVHALISYRSFARAPQLPY